VPLLAVLALLSCGFGIISLGTRTRVGASVYSSSSLAAGYGGVSVPSAAAASFSDGLPPGSAQLTTGISPASWGAASEDARLPSTTGSASATGALGGVAGRAEAGAGGAAGGPGGTVTDAGRRAARADGATSSFLDPYAHLSAADAIATSGSTSVEFDENGRRIRHKRSDEEGFVAFNHPPKREEPTGGASNRSHVDRTVHRSRAGAAAGTSVGRPPPPPMTTADRLRLRYRSRKFLFPLLDQGPNNQYLQFRVALAKARALNRTLVLPLWLPHNPKFLHLHPGAPPEPSRDKATDGLAFPFASTFDTALVAKYVRTVDLPTFRALSDGKLELCLCHGGTHTDVSAFDSYLRHSGLECGNFTSTSEERKERSLASRMRYLGYHFFDHEVGMRDKLFTHLRPSPRLLSLADTSSSALFNGSEYVAAHIRVADAHWEHSDCHHSLNGLPIPSVSCGDGVNAINYSSIAQEIWYVLRQTELKTIFVATNMNCSDWRLMRIGLMLSRRDVRLVCAKDMLRSRVVREFAIDGTSATADVQANYFLSLVEQELCMRAHSFIGSKYSTWTDTVRGERQAAASNAKMSAQQWLFEELWALGVR